MIVVDLDLKHRKDLTRLQLWKILDYCRETGTFRSLIEHKSMLIGDTIGFRHSDGYVYIDINEHTYKAHRLAWLYVYGYWPDEVDHEDQVKHHNWINNLRDVTHQENHKNMPLRKNNTSGFNGVAWNEQYKKWHAIIGIDGNTECLGYYEDKNDAIDARKEANIEYGFHHNHGTIA